MYVFDIMSAAATAAAVGATFPAEVENMCTAEEVLIEGGGLFTKNTETIEGFFMSPTRLSGMESNPLFFQDNSATSHTTEHHDGARPGSGLVS